jgi:peptidoglycan/LPS O-acetylase OafA/YrhL
VQRRLTHQPALDGVRALSVVLVVLFHAGFSWMPAGYLGVSVFFTLSGYLITSLLLAEHDSTGRIAVGEFYARRVRRLLPASLVCVGSIVVAAQLGAFANVPHLRRDLWGAVLQVFNWVQLSGGTSYADLFAGATSPLDHFWSLSIEEQCYWIWPFAVLGLLRVARGRRLVVAMGAVVVISTGIAVAVARVWGSDAAYWATPARLPEIVMGAFLACALARGHRVRAWAGWLALPVLAAMVAAAVVLPSDSGPAYEGALPAFALLSTLLIYSLQARGPMRWLLSRRPLVWLGSVSYGVYLFHWPVFVVLRERGWQLTTWQGATLALGLTLVIALVSSLLIERPVRVRPWAPARSLGLAATGTALAVVVGLVVASPTSGFAVDETALEAATIPEVASLEPLVPLSVTPTTTIDPSTTTTASYVPIVASKGGTIVTTPATTPPDTSVPTTVVTTSTTIPEVLASVPLPAAPSRPVRILVVGDSTAAALTVGLADWASAHPEQARVSSLWCAGCGFLLGGTIDTAGLAESQPDSDQLVQHDLLRQVERLKPDVVVLMSTLSDVADRTWSADEGSIAPDDPRAGERLEQAYDDVTLRLVAAGVAHVVWVVPPTPIEVLNGPEMNEPARYEAQHAAIADVIATFGSAQVQAADVDAWLTLTEHAADRAWRPDGVHLSEDAARYTAELYLGPTLVEVALGG